MPPVLAMPFQDSWTLRREHARLPLQTYQNRNLELQDKSFRCIEYTRDAPLFRLFGFKFQLPSALGFDTSIRPPNNVRSRVFQISRMK